MFEPVENIILSPNLYHATESDIDTICLMACSILRIFLIPTIPSNRGILF